LYILPSTCRCLCVLCATNIFSLADKSRLKLAPSTPYIQRQWHFDRITPKKSHGHQNSKSSMADTSPTVPDDLWVCGACRSWNIESVADASARCPSCRHVRDYSSVCCLNPGEQLQSTGLFRDTPSVQSKTWACDMVDPLPCYGTSIYLLYGSDPDNVVTSYGSLTYAAGEVAVGSWVCSNCGCLNSGMCNACMHCGQMQYSS
jgi:hypothetical protein